MNLRNVVASLRVARSRFDRWRKDPSGLRRALERLSNAIEQDWQRLRNRLEARHENVVDALNELRSELVQRAEESAALRASVDALTALVTKQQAEIKSHLEALQVHESRLNLHSRTMKRMTPAESVRFARDRAAEERRRVSRTVVPAQHTTALVAATEGDERAAETRALEGVAP